MKYSIQIRKESTLTTPLWTDYGSTTTVDNTTSFIPYSTEDISELQDKLKELDKIYGYENIRAIAVPDFNVEITILQETENESNEDNSPQTDP